VSLVSDALRKARQEAAAEQQQMQPGVVYTGAIAGYSGRSRMLTGLVLVATIAVAAAFGGGVVVWWILGRSASPDPPTTTTESTAPVLAAAEVPEQQPAAAEPEPDAEVPDHQEPSAPLALAPAPDASRRSSPAEAEVLPTSDTAPAAAESSDPSQEPQERVHVVEADLGYATLSLGFLVYRSSDPYAEINGTEVHEGQHIEGFLLEKVEQDQVRLRDDHGPLILKVR
jgi:hypothetical protein